MCEIKAYSFDIFKAAYRCALFSQVSAGICDFMKIQLFTAVCGYVACGFKCILLRICTLFQVDIIHFHAGMFNETSI